MNYLSLKFPNVVLIIYDPILFHNDFYCLSLAEQFIVYFYYLLFLNFKKKRGCELKGATKSTNQQIQRYYETGYQYVKIFNMNDAIKLYFNEQNWINLFIFFKLLLFIEQKMNFYLMNLIHINYFNHIIIFQLYQIINYYFNH